MNKQTFLMVTKSGGYPSELIVARDEEDACDFYADRANTSLTDITFEALSDPAVIESLKRIYSIHEKKFEYPDFPSHVVLEVGDWQAMYVNGRCVWQHHPRWTADSLYILAENFGIKHPTIHFYSEMDEAVDGQFPDKLTDVPAELFSENRPMIMEAN